MKEFISYAPIIIVVVMFFTQYRIFARPEDMSKLKEDLKEYMNNNFVSIKICNNQNQHVNDTIKLIREDIKDIKDKVEEMPDNILNKIKELRG